MSAGFSKLEFRGRGRNFQEMSGKRQIFFVDEQYLEGVHRGEDNIVGILSGPPRAQHRDLGLLEAFAAARNGEFLIFHIDCAVPISAVRMHDPGVERLSDLILRYLTKLSELFNAPRGRLCIIMSRYS